MKNLTLITAMLTSANTALAGETTYAAPATPMIAPARIVAAAPTSDWTGFYVGASGGSVTSETFFVFVPGTVGSEGAVYGGFLGYNYDFGSLVVGGEYEYSIGGPDEGAFYSIGSISTVKARVGYDFGSMLLYGFGGYTSVIMEGIGTDVPSDGISYGVGADYRLNDRWTIGAEYMTYADDAVFGAGQTLDLQTFSARVSYNF